MRKTAVYALLISILLHEPTLEVVINLLVNAHIFSCISFEVLCTLIKGHFPPVAFLTTTIFVIHIEGHPAPPNPTGNLPLRIRSPENWLPVSAMDTENVITFRPSKSTRVLGRCHVRDLQAAMDQKNQRDRNGTTALANVLQNTLGDPYGSLSRRSAPSNRLHYNPPILRVQQLQGQVSTPGFNPPLALRAMLTRSDQSAASGSANSRVTGRPPIAREPAAQRDSRTITYPLPARHQNTPQGATDTRGRTQQ